MLFKIFKNNTFFFVPYILVLLILIPFLVIYSKPEIHLWINGYNTNFFDWFFRHITFLGDGLFIIFPAIFLLFISLRHFTFLVTAYFSTGIVVQLLKRLLFQDVVRPAKFFEGTSLHLVEGVNQLSGRSFPSGHATSAFALFLCLALILPSRKLKLLCFILACVVAFSRVYLSQHFLVDIYAGSIIGCTGALSFYALFYRDDRNWHAWTIQKSYKNERQV